MKTEETYFNSSSMEERIAQLTDQTHPPGVTYLSKLVECRSIQPAREKRYIKIDQPGNYITF